MVQNFKWNTEISKNILNPYTAKYAFYEVLKVWRIIISYVLVRPAPGHHKRPSVLNDMI